MFQVIFALFAICAMTMVQAQDFKEILEKGKSQTVYFNAWGGSENYNNYIGWAIEGAVGSLHKVDATYLSPHVNMAARLETSSRQYGVPLLMSQVCIAYLFILFYVYFILFIF